MLQIPGRSSSRRFYDNVRLSSHSGHSQHSTILRLTLQFFRNRNEDRRPMARVTGEIEEIESALMLSLSLLFRTTLHSFVPTFLRCRVLLRAGAVLACLGSWQVLCLPIFRQALPTPDPSKSELGSNLIFFWYSALIVRTKAK